MASLRSQLLVNVVESSSERYDKVTVVGAGQVGMACAFSILTQNVSNEICLMDVSADKLKGEMLDLQQGANFLKNAKIESSTDYATSANSHICVVTAGVRQKEGESIPELVQRNTDVLKEIIPNLMKHSPNTILLIVTSPVDIMTYVAWKLSGLAKSHVIGSGTNLDSSRFQYLLSQRLGIAPSSCNGWIIGEHGDSSLPLWSGVYIGGVRLRELNPTIGSVEDSDKFNELHTQVVKASHDVIKLKGYTSWAIGLSVANIVASLFNNSSKVLAVSTLVEGCYDIDKEVFLSLPCVLNSNGVTAIVKQILTPTEIEQLQASANALAELQTDITL